MYWSALLPAAVLAFAATPAQADDIPKRKPGLWELTWYSGDVTPAQAAATQVPKSAKTCIDETTDAKLAAAYDACDPPLDFVLFLPQFKSELVCETARGRRQDQIARQDDVSGNTRTVSKARCVSNRRSKARATIAVAARVDGWAHALPICVPAISLLETSRRSSCSKS